MKIIVTAIGTLGPFNSVETLSDRYIADNNDLQFSVIGPATVEDQGDWLPPAPPQVVPAQVSPRQIRQALTQVGLRAGVEAAVAAGSQDLKDWWEFATAFERQHPMVIAMAAGLGVTDEQLDDLFVLAGSL